MRAELDRSEEEASHVSVNSMPSTTVQQRRPRKKTRSISVISRKSLSLKLLLLSKEEIRRSQEPDITPQGFITSLKAKLPTSN